MDITPIFTVYYVIDIIYTPAYIYSLKHQILTSLCAQLQLGPYSMKNQ